jgi:hypothetical protein
VEKVSDHGTRKFFVLSSQKIFPQGRKKDNCKNLDKRRNSEEKLM